MLYDESAMPSFYRPLRPLLFALPPERAHRLTLTALKLLGRVKRYPQVEDHVLQQEIWGLPFANPFGIAAGFDKDGEAIGGVLKMGFGFTEIGTLTPHVQGGNPRPRVFRLPEHRALINRLGFNNRGQINALHRLSVFRARPPRGRPRIVGVNIGAGKDSRDRLEDYEIGAARFAGMADYLTVNISSPNTPNLRELQSADTIGTLMKTVRAAAPDTPIVVKIAPDMTPDEACNIAEAALKNHIEGLVISNTTTARDEVERHRFAEQEGGLSGQPLFETSTHLLAEVFSATKGRLTLIGAGGVATPEQAYEKICAGAALVQLYTGLVYEGPGLVHRLRHGLVELLRRDGHNSIGSAIGSDV